MGLFYYFLGLLLSYAVGELNSSLFGYEERYSPRPLVLFLEAPPFEESLFFGIPFYATGNQFVHLGTGIVWTFLHLTNTEEGVFSFTSLAYANFAFTIMPFFFAFRTWKSGKGWFSILFHWVWDLAIFSFLVLTKRNPPLILSNDSHVHIELLIMLIVPALLSITYVLYKRRQKKQRTLPIPP
jgi:membrane protease YdiL (CAAX protease family)